MKEPRWTVEVTYPGFDFDQQIEKAVGRRSDGSGFGFGLRDMAWYYHQKPAAERAVARIEAINLGVDVKLIDNNDWEGWE